MKREIFGFEIDDTHIITKLDENGESVLPWRDLLAQRDLIDAPAPASSAEEIKQFEIAVDQAIVDYGCVVFRVQTNLWYKYYVAALSCQFGMDSSLTQRDREILKETMRKSLTNKVRRFCAVMQINWQQPDWIFIRG